MLSQSHVESVPGPLACALKDIRHISTQQLLQSHDCLPYSTPFLNSTIGGALKYWNPFNPKLHKYLALSEKQTKQNQNIQRKSVLDCKAYNRHA